ncbi:hypothetical protein NT6N_01520 [Oceaniferula spumae]|uniref:DUF3108 domain-containing protein n=1 Tax=Oceaniferula spumae TaxID=2979115 RepID=A0AAT9FGK8_9BACT
MKTHLLSLITACSVTLPMASLADVSIEPSGMKIVWQSLKKDFDGFETYNSSEGVYVTVAVRGGGKNVISFDNKKSKVSIQYGDQDLGGSFGMWNKTSKDGKTMRIEVKSDKLPQGDNAALKLAGSLDLVVASKTDTKTSGPRELKKGDKLTFGDNFSCEVSKIEKPKYGDDELEVSFKWDRDIPELAAVRFYDEAGKLIESKAGGWSSMGGFGKKTVTKSYLLKKKSDILKIEMDLWSDAEALTVPLNLNVGLGAGK